MSLHHETNIVFINGNLIAARYKHEVLDTTVVSLGHTYVLYSKIRFRTNGIRSRENGLIIRANGIRCRENEIIICANGKINRPNGSIVEKQGYVEIYLLEQ